MSQMQESNRKTKDDVEKITQGVYRAVSFAGEGAEGDVWFCVRLDKPIEENNCMIYAVKIMTDHFREDIGSLSEVQCLKKLGTLPITAQHYFQQLVDYDVPLTTEENSIPRWISTRAVMGCTFEEFLNYMHGPTPRPLVLNFALQLCTALQVLHGHTPPIVHGDLLDSNIMVDLQRRDKNGVPTLVLIDFRGSHTESSNTDFMRLDRVTMNALVEQLVSNWSPFAETPEDRPWINMINELNNIASLESFRASIEPLAQKAWENVSHEDKVLIEELLEESSKGMTKILTEARKVQLEHVNSTQDRLARDEKDRRNSRGGGGGRSRSRIPRWDDSSSHSGYRQRDN